MGDTILVTGASGFLGRNLVATLGQAGRPFRAIGHGTPEADADTDWSAALDGVGAIVHLAGRHVGDAARFERDVAMTLNLGRQAARHRIGRFVYLSSIKVNGEGTGAGRVFSEADAPAPEGLYGAAKLRMEQGLAGLLTVTVIRPPLVYGPGARGNFRRLVQAVERGWPLPLGAVDNRRSMISTGNLCDFILKVLDMPETAGETYLVSDGEDISTSELLRRLARVLGRPSRLLAVSPGLLESGLRLVGRSSVADRLLGDLRVDSGKARRLGWNPPLSVDEGLAAAAWQGEV